MQPLQAWEGILVLASSDLDSAEYQQVDEGYDKDLEFVGEKEDENADDDVEICDWDGELVHEDVHDLEAQYAIALSTSIHSVSA